MARDVLQVIVERSAGTNVEAAVGFGASVG